MMDVIKRPGLVVSGLAVRNGKVLMGKRKTSSRRPGLWELPGGKIEVDVDGDPVEFPYVALRREWQEEMGLEVTVGDWIATTPVLDLETRFTVDLYHVRFDEPFPPRFPPAWDSHDEVGWFDLATAVVGMPCSPAFYLHYPAIREWMARQPRLAPTK